MLHEEAAGVWLKLERDVVPSVCILYVRGLRDARMQRALRVAPHAVLEHVCVGDLQLAHELARVSVRGVAGGGAGGGGGGGGGRRRGGGGWWVISEGRGAVGERARVVQALGGLKATARRRPKP